MDFTATVQTTPDQIAALPPAADDDEITAIDEDKAPGEPAPTHDQEVENPARRVPEAAEPVRVALTEPPPVPEPEPAEAAAERERRYHEIFGTDEEKPRHRWRR